MTAATFAAVFIAMFAGHHIGDHVAQTDWQAKNKAQPDGVGWMTSWWAMVGHVLTYHAIVLFALGAVRLVLDLPISGVGTVTGIAFSMVTHAFLDRRWPVRWLLKHTASEAFAESTTPLHGCYLADQSLHVACLFVAALLVVSVGG